MDILTTPSCDSMIFFIPSSMNLINKIKRFYQIYSKCSKYLFFNIFYNINIFVPNISCNVKPLRFTLKSEGRTARFVLRVAVESLVYTNKSHEEEQTTTALVKLAMFGRLVTTKSTST